MKEVCQAVFERSFYGRFSIDLLPDVDLQPTTTYLCGLRPVLFPAFSVTGGVRLVACEREVGRAGRDGE